MTSSTGPPASASSHVPVHPRLFLKGYAWCLDLTRPAPDPESYAWRARGDDVVQMKSSIGPRRLSFLIGTLAWTLHPCA